MDYRIEQVRIEDEFKVCPACGYRDGFHAMLKKEAGKRYGWLFICPSCHAVYDIGHRVELDPKTVGG